jgi:DNA polymerase III subunit beta
MSTIRASAKKLAAALDLAAALISPRDAKESGLAAARLVGTDNRLSIITSNTYTQLTITIEADAGGAINIAAKQLADLTRNFGAGAEVTITKDETTATIASGRSSFKLPTVSDDYLPSLLDFGDETGRVVLNAADAGDLFRRPVFAIAADDTRLYLGGLFLHDVEGGLAGIATDGTRLARIIIPAATSLSRDRSLIVPVAKAISKLLDRDGDVTLCRSKALFSITGKDFTFVSRLVDAGSYPDYGRLITPSTGSCIVERAALIASLARFAACRDPQRYMTARVILKWGDGQLRITSPNSSADEFPAMTNGTGHAALNINKLTEQLHELRGPKVELGNANPVMITDPDDANFITLLATMLDREDAA